MTDIQHINVDDEQWDGTPRALREHVDKLQKALKERDQQISGLREQQTASALSDVLAGFKNPERVKRDLLGDKVDPLSSEAVSEWLKSNADDYARTTETPADPVQNVEDEDPQVPDFGGINAPGQIGDPALADKAQVLAAAPKNASPQELIAYYAQHGI